MQIILVLKLIFKLFLKQYFRSLIFQFYYFSYSNLKFLITIKNAVLLAKRKIMFSFYHN